MQNQLSRESSLAAIMRRHAIRSDGFDAFAAGYFYFALNMAAGLRRTYDDKENSLIFLIEAHQAMRGYDANQRILFSAECVDANGYYDDGVKKSGIDLFLQNHMLEKGYMTEIANRSDPYWGNIFFGALRGLDSQGEMESYYATNLQFPDDGSQYLTVMTDLSRIFTSMYGFDCAVKSLMSLANKLAEKDRRGSKEVEHDVLEAMCNAGIKSLEDSQPLEAVDYFQNLTKYPEFRDMAKVGIAMTNLSIGAQNSHCLPEVGFAVDEMLSGLTHALEGIAFFRKGRYQDAIEKLKLVINERMKIANSSKILTRFYEYIGPEIFSSLAYSLYRIGDKDAATLALIQGHGTHPKNMAKHPAALQLQGTLSIESGRDEFGYALLRKGARIQSDLMHIDDPLYANKIFSPLDDKRFPLLLKYRKA